MTIKKFNPLNACSLRARLFFLIAAYPFGLMVAQLTLSFFGVPSRWDGAVGGLLAMATITTLDTMCPQWHPAVRSVLGMAAGIAAVFLLKFLF